MQSAPAKVTAGHHSPVRGILFDKDGTLLDFCATWIRADEVMVVGDTPHDMEMARAAGVACRVGVLSGAGTREALEPIADCVIASIANLDAVLRSPTPPRAAAADMHACARSAQ